VTEEIKNGYSREVANAGRYVPACSIFPSNLKAFKKVRKRLIILNLRKRGSTSFPSGLQKIISKDAKSLQIKSLQAFFLASKHQNMQRIATKRCVIRCVGEW
jgi:hypothetical protein